MTLHTNKGVIIWPRRALRASRSASDWRGVWTGGRAWLLFVHPTFVSCSFPLDYTEEKILKYIHVALLPAAKVKPLCWEGKSKHADSRGWPAAPAALVLLPPAAPYQGKQRSSANASPPTQSLIPTACTVKECLCVSIIDLLRPLSSCKPNRDIQLLSKSQTEEMGGSWCCWTRISSANNWLICIQNSGGLSPFGVRKHISYRLLLPATHWVLYCFGPTG